MAEDRPVHLCPAPVEGFDEAVKNIWDDPPKPVPAGLVGSNVACHACHPNLDFAISIKEMTSHRRTHTRRRVRKAAGDCCFSRTCSRRPTPAVRKSPKPPPRRPKSPISARRKLPPQSPIPRRPRKLPPQRPGKSPQPRVTFLHFLL